ncbi:MAG: extracellular solute-binding protein [Butyrivibrio sp.]|uniref:sugar ABC transporter substrate-binding protein n=1 Tax=Butyrivibrio sp. TaxID=28121 RepID=UPI001B02A4D9|nr:extracellular solute-binding protein [Butyrivibrio sp.]MBO6240244.1 extracellular solute-binding protein [Butyrivibrio sp.]
MRLRIKIFSILLVLCMLSGTILYAQSKQSAFEDRSLFSLNKTTVRIWYTDDALTPYLQNKAVAFSESRNRIRIEPVLVSGLEYLEAINKASLEEDNYPDLYIITNDSLEKAYLAGLALEIDNGVDFLDEETFPASAINSVTYNDRLVAYPFYYETSSLIYNKTYLENMIADEELDIEVEDLIPHTIADILKFAQSYNAPDQVEAVFKWDVTDIFYNYFFVGNYMNVGGKAGDDVSLIDIYNSDTISCMKIYQQLNQFFAIDAKEIDYDSVVQDFIDGKIVFTVATTDVLSKIEAAKAAGECDYEFAVADIPDITQNYKTRTMSVTDCIVVNGYSEHISEANSFARYLLNDNSGDIYSLSGKMAAHFGVNYGNSNLDTFTDVYADSVPMPKTIETSNLWMELEIAFTRIWNGEDCNTTLKNVSESIMTQVTGEAFEEETIPDPTDLDITDGLTEDSD